MLKPALCQAYAPYFRIGAAVSSRMTAVPALRDLICRHFNSLTADNQMKPMFLMDRESTLASGDRAHVALRFAPADDLLSFARDAGVAVRFHTLVWHNQTPRWFFTADWSDAPDAPFASREIMLERLEHYVQDVMRHVNEAFPGLVYTWDVVNEAIEPDHRAPGFYRTRSPWYAVLGEDFIPAAFRAARRGQAPGQTLCYNDYNAFQPVKRDAIIALLEKLMSENLVDTMGMQGHYILKDMDIPACEAAARAYAALGLKLQVTELDIHCTDGNETGQLELAGAYGRYFEMLVRLRREGIPIEAVTFWGVTDADSWLTGFRRERSYPLLFSGGLQAKPAFDAVLAAAL